MATDSPIVLGSSGVSGANVLLGPNDRRRHLHVIGKTGTGKSTLLLNMMLQDLSAGRGFALLDPHGDLAKDVIDAIPRTRTNDVLYLNPADYEHPVAFNPLAGVPEHGRALTAAHMVAAFKHIWADSWGPRLEYVLMNGLRLLLDAPGTTLLGLPRLLADERYRRRLLATCRDPLVRAFWTRELPSWGHSFTAEALSPVQNKVGALLSPPILRNIIGQPRSTIDLPAIMNERRVLIANLSKATIGEGPAHLLGAFLATAFAQAAEARAGISEAERVDFTLYADEFQNFATDSFATVLSEARKWRLSLTLAHQYLGQLPAALRQAVMGNTGSLIAFRIGADDAKAIAAEMDFESAGALTDLSKFTAWAKLMSDNDPDNPIHLSTALPHVEYRRRTRRVVARTRARHTRPRAKVEARISRFANSR